MQWRPRLVCFSDTRFCSLDNHSFIILNHMCNHTHTWTYTSLITECFRTSQFLPISHWWQTTIPWCPFSTRKRDYQQWRQCGCIGICGRLALLWYQVQEYHSARKCWCTFMSIHAHCSFWLFLQLVSVVCALCTSSYPRHGAAPGPPRPLLDSSFAECSTWACPS